MDTRYDTRSILDYITSAFLKAISGRMEWRVIDSLWRAYLEALSLATPEDVIRVAQTCGTMALAQ